MLGDIEVERAGERVTVGAPQLRRLLALFIIERRRAIPRDALIDRLWNGVPPATATTSVHVHVNRLRQILEPEHAARRQWRVLRSTPSGYLLDVEDPQIDVHLYEDCVASAESAPDPGASLRHLDRAEGVWRDPPYAELADAIWARDEVERVMELHRRAAELWADANLALGLHDGALEQLRRAVRDEPFRERRWEQLILALYRAGRQVDALQTYREVRTLLREQLGVDPRPQLRELERAVLLQDHSLDLSTDPRRPRRVARHNLPLPASSIVGRTVELHDLQEAMERHRVLALTGAAGTGKTRLAIALSHREIERFADGAWLVDMSTVDSPALAVGRIVSEFGLREADEHGPAGPLDLLERFLRDRELLLVLDGCEKVAAETVRIVELLVACCERVRFLVTSRVRLGINGERCMDIAPLSVPKLGAPLDDVVASTSVRLFLDRAYDAGAPPFRAADLEAVAELCRAVDGIPLAIEMAASHVHALAPQEIAASVRARSSSTQRTKFIAFPLDATIEWNNALLAPIDRSLMRDLCAFSAPFTLGGARHLGAGLGLDPDGVAGSISRLVAASLVRFDSRNRVARYKILETVRAHVQAQSSDASAEIRVRDRIAAYLCSVASSVRPSTFLGPPDRHAIETLDAELDNVRAELERLIAARAEEPACRLAFAMATYWMERGHWGEGQRWLSAVLALGPPRSSLRRGCVLSGLVRVTSSFAGIAARRGEAEQAVAIFRAHDARDDLSIALVYVAFAAGWQGDFRAMSESFAEADELVGARDEWTRRVLDVYRGLARVMRGNLRGVAEDERAAADALLALGDQPFAARALFYAGTVARLSGDQENARRDLARSIELTRRFGTHGTEAHALLALAQLSADAGAPDARTLLLDSLETLETIGDARCVALCETALARLASLDGAHEEAFERLRRAVPTLAALDRPALALAFAETAELYRATNNPRGAQVTADCAQALARAPALPWTETERRRFESLIGRHEPDSQGFAINLDELVERALDVVSTESGGHAI